METGKNNQMAGLARSIKSWANELGFQHTGISDIDLQQAESRLSDWLAHGYHGQMHYMEKHGSARSHPEELVAGTLRVISVRMDYLPEPHSGLHGVLDQPDKAYISRYALGRDYHKVIRNRLQKLADRITGEIGDFGYRVFTDSAPVLEKPIAEKAGLGWIGKNTNLISREAGSWFFLGEIYTDLPLPTDNAASNHCGDCSACIDVCPTKAIIAPYIVDARKCISYLTIELEGSIPTEFRKAIGNRIYGCDDCQIVCPWNRFANVPDSSEFKARNGLDSESLIGLFSWTETEFLERMQGSAIRRIGHDRWIRNIAVALGNAPTTSKVISALNQHAHHESEMVREHVVWALSQHDRSD